MIHFDAVFVYLWHLKRWMLGAGGTCMQAFPNSPAFIKCHYQYFEKAGQAETRHPLADIGPYIWMDF